MYSRLFHYNLSAPIPDCLCGLSDSPSLHPSDFWFNVFFVIFSGYVWLVNSALHASGVAKSSTSFGWDKSGKVTSAGWQVTLCDPIWHVISCSGVVISITNCYIRVYFTLLYFSGRL